jgi:precorrin-3B synthase
MALGERISPVQAARRAVEITHWFSRHRGDITRMRRLVGAGLAPPLDADTAPLTCQPPEPGPGEFGLCLALPFGQIHARSLREIAVAPLRLTPWRSVLLEGVTALPSLPDGLISDATDPLLRVAACTGAPGCASASVVTRTIARELAPLIPAGCTLHVSGCAKGCAHPGATDLTATGEDGRFDLVQDGPAGAIPVRRGLSPDELLNLLRGQLAP